MPLIFSVRFQERERLPFEQCGAPRGYFFRFWLVRDKVWFDISHEGETDYNIIKELPEGADTNRFMADRRPGPGCRMSLTPGNVLTANGVLILTGFTATRDLAIRSRFVSVHNHNYL